MDGIIEVRVGGSHLSKDNQKAGLRGEANVCKLRISFDESWDGYIKEVVFWDAHGGNPVKRTLTELNLEDIIKSTRVFLVSIPQEALVEAGEMTFVVEGRKENQIKRVQGKLTVIYAPDSIEASEPTDPELTEIQEINARLEIIINEIQLVSGAVIETRGYKDETFEQSQLAKGYADNAQSYQDKAYEYMVEAEKSVGKTSYIGSDGFWYEYDSKKHEFYNTGVRAQAGSMVWYGDNPPDEASVWIDPNGVNGNYAPYVGTNGNWFIFDFDTEEFVDSGYPSMGGNFNDAIAGVVGKVEELRTEGKTIVEAINELEKKLPRKIKIYLPASAWVEVDNEEYAQVVVVSGVTAYSQIDLQITKEQLDIFREKDITFWVENENGTVTVHCLGKKPTSDYEIQATKMEVVVDE